ncbi:hypothetical protein AAFF_G00150320 [Aldrovandia affinis]|uniref:Uncharacterized protein n=1 Tax=Aldrovandia affinis TaxID=143900 RepID=A0AAD7W8C5_9TELE|nr:hypothetical protein AAFF_G00150320 [Aldrovandia affinis]
MECAQETDISRRAENAEDLGQSVGTFLVRPLQEESPRKLFPREPSQSSGPPPRPAPPSHLVPPQRGLYTARCQGHSLGCLSWPAGVTASHATLGSITSLGSQCGREVYQLSCAFIAFEEFTEQADRKPPIHQRRHCCGLRWPRGSKQRKEQSGQAIKNPHSSIAAPPRRTAQRIKSDIPRTLRIRDSGKKLSRGAGVAWSIVEMCAFCECACESTSERESQGMRDSSIPHSEEYTPLLITSLDSSTSRHSQQLKAPKLECAVTDPRHTVTGEARGTRRAETQSDVRAQ